MMESLPHSWLRLTTVVPFTWVSSCWEYTPILSLTAG